MRRMHNGKVRAGTQACCSMPANPYDESMSRTHLMVPPTQSSSALPSADQDAVSFGPYTLVAGERLLTRDGARLALGGRALDVLIVLVARAGTVVSKQDLMAQAWPGVVVSEGSLRFQITLLRQALGDGIDGARYITNVVGRGYSFVAEVSTRRSPPAPDTRAAAGPVETSLPAPTIGLVGRDEDI